MSAGVVIAGGGLAAQRCAETLRRSGYDAAVRIVSGEVIAPYDRPPLSKAFLSGDAEGPEIALRPAGWHAEHHVELLLGEEAAGLDAGRRRLILESGSTLRYDHLVIATGSRPRMPAAAAAYDNVHSLRTLGDAARLRDELRPGRRLVVLGAGLIGQEVAATASGAGVDVTLVEAEDLPLARVLHPDISRWLVGLQREQGVDVQLGVPVTAFEGAGRTLRALRVADGRRVELDMLLVAIGVTPCTEWLPAAIGQLVRRPDISAAGDAAGGNHWEAAAAQGRATALEHLGTPAARAGEDHELVERHPWRAASGSGRPHASRDPRLRRRPGRALLHRRRLPRRSAGRRARRRPRARRSPASAASLALTDEGGSMTLVPTVDPAACAAHGDCVEIAPTVFALDGDVAEVIGGGDDAAILAAAEACPSVAIVVTDAETGERVYP